MATKAATLEERIAALEKRVDRILEHLWTPGAAPPPPPSRSTSKRKAA